MDSSSSEPPKLALFSFPSNRRSDGPGELTPPVASTVASIPFEWEEAPGKPRPSRCGSTSDDQSKPSSSSTVIKRSLEPPPRLVLTDHYYHHNNINNVSSSPTTVLEGPYVARSLSSYKGGSSSFRIPAASESKYRVLFGSSRWVTGTTTSSSVKRNDEIKVVRGTFDFFPPSAGGGGGGGGPKVKITRVRKRSGSFRTLSHSTSHLWTNICESFKQVVPWRVAGKRN